MKILIVDYGMGNLGSVRRTFEKCGVESLVSDDFNQIEHCDKIVLPGVGAFSEAIERLKEKGWHEALKNACIKKNKSLLGICLGMQLLADASEETENGNNVEGLGLIAGKVKRLNKIEPHEKIPHVGWNEVVFQMDSPLFQNIKSNSDFYFVHSYHLMPEYEDNILSHTPYCGNFVSAINKDSIWGVQFHPEKSSKSGIQLIKNFVSL
jgi:glutamine amidotransferase